jgi:hypothetical protein
VGSTTIAGPATPLEYWQGWQSILLRGWQTIVRFLMLAVIMHRAWIGRNLEARHPKSETRVSDQILNGLPAGI